MASLVIGSVQADNYTGAAVTHTVTQDGAIEFDIWGGAGGGSLVTAATGIDRAGSRAGGGGHTTGFIAVVAGDVIKIEVGRGGRKVTALATQALGGWPDGGNGGQGANSGAENYGGGGGGGSTRIYKNNVLVAVAGAGGGGMRGIAGGGGGTSGGTSLAAGGGAAIAGGTQSTAGNGGGPLQGGNATHQSSNASGGGGGGYFGGGAQLNIVCPGGGGSGFLSGVQGGSTTAAPTSNNGTADFGLGSAADAGDAYYPGAPIALGGLDQRQSAANTTDGGNGYSRVELRPSSVIANLPVNVAASGSDQTVNVTRNAIMNVSLWGGAGGGAKTFDSTAPSPRGGGGGYTTVSFSVSNGDVVLFKVGKGGKKGIGATSALGGWPDGGVATAPLNSSFGPGGGGGGSRVYLNGVLMGIAGGGGGSGGSSANGSGAGAGGGTSGQSQAPNGATLGGGSGGSQTAGGVNQRQTTVAGYKGSSLQGGRGSPNGATSADNGAGGGGGYFGGGGAGFDTGAGGYYSAAGGGSGYINPSLTGTTTAGNLAATAGTSDPKYPGAPIAQGGVSDVSAPQDGSDGAITYDYTDLVGGNIGTVPLVAPAATVSAGFSKTFALGLTAIAISGIIGAGSTAVNVNALQSPLEVIRSGINGAASVSAGGTGALPGPVNVQCLITATADTSVYAFGQPFPVITCIPDLQGTPTRDAFITVDLLFELNPPVISALLLASGTGRAEPLVLPFTPPQVILIEVEGFYYSEDQNTPVNFGTPVTVTGINGYAAQAKASPPLPAAFTTQSLISASATGQGLGSGEISFIASNGIGGVMPIPPEGIPFTADMNTTATFTTKVEVEAVRGVGLVGNAIVLAVGQSFPRVTMEVTNTELRQASGGGNAYSLQNSYSNQPGDNFLVRVRNTTIEGNSAGAANREVFFDTTITFQSPQGLTIRGASVLAPIGIVYLRRQLGGAGENPAFEGDALAGADLRDYPVTITPPESQYQISGNALGMGQMTVLVLPPPVEASVGQDNALLLPGPVIVTSPEGLAFPVNPESTALADLTATVILTPPEGFSAVTVSRPLPGPVVIFGPTTIFRLVRTVGTAVFVREVSGVAVFHRVENRTVVIEDVIERTVVMRD